MKKINDGGAAFPQADIVDGAGMSLRDYFAAKAMQALLVGHSPNEGAWDVESDAAYEIADAMLEARDKK